MPEQELTTPHSSQSLKVMDSVFKVMDNPSEEFWVDTDCGKAAAKVYQDLYGYDVMSDLKYSGYTDTQKTIGKNIYHRVLRTLVPQGFKLIKEELPGCLGLVKMANSEVAVGICVKEGLWAVRHETGFCLLNLKAEAVLYNHKDNN